MKFTPQKYSFLELMFNKYRWVRKLSRGFYVLRHEDGYSWVKFDKEEAKSLNIFNNPEYTIEDWTKEE